MTHKEAIIFVHNCPRAEKSFYIKSLGEVMFRNFISIGFLTTNIGMYYWTTRLFNDYYREIFNSKKFLYNKIIKQIIIK